MGGETIKSKVCKNDYWPLTEEEIMQNRLNMLYHPDDAKYYAALESKQIILDDEAPNGIGRLCEKKDCFDSYGNPQFGKKGKSPKKVKKGKKVSKKGKDRRKRRSSRK
jgi:hypothetical protein